MSDESPLKGKTVLVVDDEPDVLDTVAEELDMCIVDKASDYNTALQYLASYTYDIVILDIMGVNGFELLENSVDRGFPSVMLTAHALTPEALKRSYDMKAYAFLPKEKLADIVPFLEDVLKYDYAAGWKRLLQKLHGFFSDRFVSDWEKQTGLEWKEWSK